MKFRNMLAAASLVIASLGVSAAAEAQPRPGDRWEQNQRRDRYDRHDRGRRDRYKRDHRRGRYERSHRYRNRSSHYRSHHRDRCRTVWRNGRQWQVC